MTPSDRINYWLKCRPLAEANQRRWIAAVLADGMKCGAEIAADCQGPQFTREENCMVRDAMIEILAKSKEMEEVGKLPS